MAVDEAVVASVRTRPWRRRRVLVATALVVVAALITTWQVLARAARLERGEFWQSDTAAVSHPLTGPDDSQVTDPADGTYDGMWSFRNTGPLPVTVRIARRGPDAGFVQNQTIREIHLVPVDPDTGQVGWGESVDSARLAPGAEVGVAFQLGAGCWQWQAGTGYGASSVFLDVESLGVTRTVLADGGWTAWVIWTHDIAPDPATCS